MSTDSSVIKLEGIDRKGEKRNVVLRARTIDPITKQDNPASRADEVDPFKSKMFSSKKIISPKYPLEKLITLKEESTELGQAIETMVTNTAGFGYQLRERVLPENDRSKYIDEIVREKAMLKAFLDTIHPKYSFDMLRKRVKNDQHSCGNGYLELIENRRGELVGVNHVQGHLVRLTELDKEPVRVVVPRVRPDRNYTIEKVSMYHRFRKYVMIRNNKPTWFREAGDPRTMDKTNGEFVDKITFDNQATSLLHFSVYSATSPYGIPEWIGNLFSIYGSREAEEINYSTLHNNAIPSMFVIVENGTLTESSIERLREWTEQQIQKSLNRSKFMLLEGESLEEAAPTPTSFKIRVEPLKQLQQEDQLFQNYDQNNKEKIRQAFRLPPIFVGSTTDYSRAVADTSRDIADEQVFAPERNDDDFLINRFIVQRWKSRFHVFRSNHPNITDDIELIRLMAIAERSGGMTPRRADRIIRDVFGDDVGRLPQGIDLDKPFSITFAEAQKGGGMGGAQGLDAGGDPAKGVLQNLVSLRQSIEKELDDRFLTDLEEDNE